MSYQEFWDRQSETVEAAIRAVDGSSDETTVQHTGVWTAKQVAYALDLQTTDRVLELGCGVGRIGKELAPRCAHWVGSDISPNMLRAAAHRLEGVPNITLQQLERSSFDDVFADGDFNKAYSVAVFCHMDKEDLFLYLRDLYRVMRPGGIIYVETWNLAHPVGWRRWEYEVRKWSRLAASDRKDAGRNQFCHPSEFALYVKQAGFDLLAQHSDSPWTQIVAGKEPSGQRRQDLRAHLDQYASVIAYSETFSKCFEKTIHLQNGDIDIKEMNAFLDSIEGTEEAALFRPYIEGKWIRPNSQYRELVEDIRQIIESTLPPVATVIIASKGDEDLLPLTNRVAWHFPQEKDGSYSGHHPENSAAAIRQLERLREEGGEFLVLPATMFWWLPFYSEFAAYLAEHYPAVEHEEICLIYRLTETATGDRKPDADVFRGGPKNRKAL